MLTWIGIIVVGVAIALTLFLYAVYCGLFDEIVVATGKPEVSKMTVVYKFARGPYKDCGSLFTEASSLTTKHRTIGIYYDDPKKVFTSC